MKRKLIVNDKVQYISSTLEVKRAFAIIQLTVISIDTGVLCLSRSRKLRAILLIDHFRDIALYKLQPFEKIKVFEKWDGL